MVDFGIKATNSELLGNNQFKERIEATLGKSVGHIGRGRPKVRLVG